MGPRTSEWDEARHLVIVLLVGYVMLWGLFPIPALAQIYEEATVAGSKDRGFDTNVPVEAGLVAFDSGATANDDIADLGVLGSTFDGDENRPANANVQEDFSAGVQTQAIDSPTPAGVQESSEELLPTGESNRSGSAQRYPHEPQSAEVSFTSQADDGFVPIGDPIDDPVAMYGAYLEKLRDYLITYGSPELCRTGETLHDDWLGVAQGGYLKGLGLAVLIDFDGDGREEMLVSYQDPVQLTEAGAFSSDAQVTEIWTYSGGEVKVIFREYLSNDVAQGYAPYGCNVELHTGTRASDGRQATLIEKFYMYEDRSYCHEFYEVKDGQCKIFHTLEYKKIPGSTYNAIYLDGQYAPTDYPFDRTYMVETSYFDCKKSADNDHHIEGFEDYIYSLSGGLYGTKTIHGLGTPYENHFGPDACLEETEHTHRTLERMVDTYARYGDDAYIVEQVRKYTESSGLYEEFEGLLSDKSIGYEQRYQMAQELMVGKGYLGVVQGLEHIKDVTTLQRSYVTLMLDDMYLANQFGHYLNETPKGIGARVALEASDFIFNSTYSGWMNVQKLAHGETPPVTRYKALLYDFIDNSAVDIERMESIKFLSSLLGKVNGSAKIYIDNVTKSLNDAKTVGEVDDIISSIRFSDLDIEYTDKGFKLDSSTGFGKYAKASGYATGAVSLIIDSFVSAQEFATLDVKLKCCSYYRGFLEEVRDADDLPDEMRAAASIILEEIDEETGPWRKLEEVAATIFGDATRLAGTSPFAIVTSKKLGTVMESVLGESVSSWITAVKISAWFVNKLSGVGSTVKNAILTDGYVTLSKHFREKLEQDRAQFSAVEGPLGAWAFFEDYSTLWQLRIKGEKAYLKMQGTGGLTSILRKHDYTIYAEAVKENIEALKSCRFTLDEAVVLPTSAAFATKLVVDCPVDVSVYAPDGTRVAELLDGVEQDFTNPHGRFITTRRAWTGEWAKVALIENDSGYTFTATGLGSGLMSARLENSEGVFHLDHVTVTSGMHVHGSMGDSRVDVDDNADGKTDAVLSWREETSSRVPVQSIVLSDDSLNIAVGDEQVLDVSVSPEDATDQTVRWVSLDEEVAVVQNGRVTGVGVGSTTIRCISLDDPEVISDCHLEVGPATIVHSGVWGTCPWEIDANGSLKVYSGVGADTRVPLASGRYEWNSPWGSIEQIQTITSVRFVSNGSGCVVAPKDCYGLLQFLNNVTSIDLSGLDTSNTEDMSYMFFGCCSLPSLDVSHLNTSGVTNMSGLFNGCSTLRSLDVTRFDTRSVTDMGGLFMGCSMLRSLDVSGFDTSQVLDLESAFWGCASLQSLDLACWKTPKVTSTASLFSQCSSLRELDLSGFDTSSAQNRHHGMFDGCQSLTSLRVGEGYKIYDYEMVPAFTSKNGKWWSKKAKRWYTRYEIADNRSDIADTYTNVDSEGEDAGVENYLISGTWGTCPWELRTDGTLTIHKGKGASLPGDIEIVGKDSHYIHAGQPWYLACEYVKKVVIGRGVVLPEDCSGLFCGCVNLESVDMSESDTSGVGSMDRMFLACKRLSELDLPECDLSNVRNMHGLLAGCNSLDARSLQGLDTSSVTDMGSMLSGVGCEGTLDLRSWDVGNVTNMRYLFHDIGFAGASVALNISGWDTSKVEDAYYMFGSFSRPHCLTSVSCRGLDFGSCRDFTQLFYCCDRIESLDLRGWDVSSVENMREMFSGCSSLRHIEFGNWDTSKVTDMDKMFNGCSSLRSIEISGWDVSSVGGFANMFNGCSSLEVLDLSSWTGRSSSGYFRINGMFSGCSSLKRVDLSSFDTSAITYNWTARNVYEDCGSLAVLKVGERYDIKHPSMFPDATAVNGKWWSAKDGKWYTKDEIVSSRSGVADTYASEVSAVPGLLRDGWVTLASGAKGYARGGSLVTGWMTMGEDKYWFDSKGAAATGWKTVSGQTYYFRPGDYRMARGWATVGGKKLIFRADGRVGEGWVSWGSDKYYAHEGVPRTGWQTIDGTRYYFRGEGDWRMASGWATVEGSKLLFRADGRLADGWVTLAGARYYADAGVPREGWQDIADSGRRFFRAAPDYRMACGWATIGSDRYWFDARGRYATGTVVINGKTYTFASDGRRIV